MLQPNRRKFRKEHKGRNEGLATRGTKVSFGEWGLKATGRGRLTARQIEAARRAMTRHIKRGGRIWGARRTGSSWGGSRWACCGLDARRATMGSRRVQPWSTRSATTRTAG